VASGQMKSMADPAPTELTKFGLDKPAYTVTFGAGSARSTFLVGTKTPEGQYYAKDGSRPMVFTVEGFLVEDLNKPVADFRVKDQFEFRTFNGTRVEITRAGATTTFEKRKGKTDKEPEKWVQAQPAKQVDESKIIDALSNLSNLRADSFVDALPAGASQALQVKARFESGKKEETVTFFKGGEDLYAIRPAEPGAAKVSTTSFDNAVKALDAVK
jgi:hypothetical protein